MLKSPYLPIAAFSALYLLFGGIYFARDLNFEFVIYVGAIIGVFALVFLSINYTKFPVWMMWLLSIWGLFHVLGGIVLIGDGVLFSYKIYPFLDFGGDFYILKYDQLIHFYLYGLVALMAHHVLRVPFGVVGHNVTVFIAAVLISVGISSLNEIMEFLIAVSIERNGVGGYENAMLDLIFNLSGAVVYTIVYTMIYTKENN